MKTARCILDDSRIATLSTKEARALGEARHILQDVDLDIDKVFRTGPVWTPGDVMVVRFQGKNFKPYTYTRGSRNWPGEKFPKSDEQMTDLWKSGLATHVMRDGELTKEGRALAGAHFAELLEKRAGNCPPLWTQSTYRQGLCDGAALIREDRESSEGTGDTMTPDG